MYIQTGLSFIILLSATACLMAESTPPIVSSAEPTPTPTPVSSIELGPRAKATAGSSVAIGAGASVERSETGGVAIGSGAVIAPPTKEQGGVGGGGNVAIGNNAKANGWRDIAIGANAIAGKVSATVVGFGAIGTYTHALVLGRGAIDTEPNQTVLGSMDNRHVYFANGHSHRLLDPPALTAICKYVPLKFPIFLHGPDATDRVDGTSTHVLGGALNLCGGRGTGTGDGGPVTLMTAPAAGAGPNVKNTLQPALQVDANQKRGETRLLLLDIDSGAMSRVVVHKVDIGGKTIRVLGFAE